MGVFLTLHVLYCVLRKSEKKSDKYQVKVIAAPADDSDIIERWKRTFIKGKVLNKNLIFLCLPIFNISTNEHWHFFFFFFEFVKSFAAFNSLISFFRLLPFNFHEMLMQLKLFIEMEWTNFWFHCSAISCEF